MPDDRIQPQSDSPRLIRSRWPKAVGRDTVDLTALLDPVESGNETLDETADA